MKRLFFSFVAALCFISGGGAADAPPPMAELLRAKAAAEAEVAARFAAQERLRAITIAKRDALAAAASKMPTPQQHTGANDGAIKGAVTALAKAKTAYDEAVKQEQAGVFAGLQADAARRRTTQAVADTVESYIAEGDALERAAARAARDEVAPSATDTLSCELDLCRPIPALEHAALAQMGAVADTFDAEAWKGAERAAEISVLPRLGDVAPRLRGLRRALVEAERNQQEASTGLAKARRALDAALKPWEGAVGNAIDAFRHPRADIQAESQALAAVQEMSARNAALTPLIAAHAAAATAKDKADQTQAAARAALREAVRGVADQARALKWAASLAEAGYMLNADDPTEACVGRACRPASGWEAAAFVVIGAVDGDVDLGRRAFAPLADLLQSSGDRYVFAAPAQ